MSTDLRISHWLCRKCKVQILHAVTHHAPVCTKCGAELDAVTRDEQQTRALAEKLGMEAARCACGMYFLRRVDQHELRDCPSCWLEPKISDDAAKALRRVLDGD